MAINPSFKYPGKVTNPDAAYPYGSARNISVPGDGLGTPLEKNWVNDVFGLIQSALSDLGAVPNGTPDSVTNPQILNAIKRAKELQSVAEARTKKGAYTGEVRYLIGHTTTGDGGEGFFIWNGVSVAADDNGVTLGAFTAGRWVRVYPGFVSPAWFGARTGTTIAAACAVANSKKGVVKLTGGTHAVNTAGLNFLSAPLDIAPGCGMVISAGCAPVNVAIYEDPRHTIITCGVADTPTLSGVDYTRPEQFGGGVSGAQKAIKATPWEVLFSAKTYVIDAELSIPSNRTLNLSTGAVLQAGAGFMTSGTGKSMLIFESDAHHIKIKGGTIDGNLLASDLLIWPNAAGNSVSPFSRPVNLIVLQSNDYVEIDGVRFINSIGTAVKEFGIFGVNQGTHQKFTNCYFDNILGNCIDGNMDYLEVTANTVGLIGDIRGGGTGGTKGGLVVVKSRIGTISDNVINQTTDSSIYVTGTDGGHITVTGNTIKYSGKDAIKVLESSAHCTISANVIIAAGKSCIGVYDNGVNDNGHSVIGHNIIGFIDAPTDILDPLNSYAPKTITGCSNQSALWVGLFETSVIGINASNLIVTGNKVDNAHGNVCNPTEQNAIVTNNIFTNATGVGLRIQSSEFIVSNNILQNMGSDATKSYDSKIYGIHLVGGAVLKGEITGNIIKTTGADAIFGGTADINDLTISGNNISEWSGSAAVYINGAGTPGTMARVGVFNNSLKGSNNTLRGIYLRNIDDLVVTGNIVEVASDGIRIQACGDVVVSSNRVTNASADGIRISDATVSASVIGNTADTAVRGVVVDITTGRVEHYGNFGTNCSTASTAILGVVINGEQFLRGNTNDAVNATSASIGTQGGIYAKKKIATETDFKAITAGKGIVLTNAAGSVTRRARLNDTGDGFIFEAE